MTFNWIFFETFIIKIIVNDQIKLKKIHEISYKFLKNFNWGILNLWKF